MLLLFSKPREGSAHLFRQDQMWCCSPPGPFAVTARDSSIDESMPQY